MSNLPISSKYVSTPDRVVDAAERDEVVARVNAAFEAGAFDDLDYRRYLDAAFSAKTLGELRPVVERLPASPTYETPSNVESSSIRPGELSAPSIPATAVILTALGVIAVAAVALVLMLVATF